MPTTIENLEPLETPSNLISKTVGSNSYGEYTDFEIQTDRGVLATRLEGRVLKVDWVESKSVIFQLKMIQDAAGGPRAFNVIKGYATDVLADKIKIPGYIQRFANAVGARLGGVWKPTLEPVGAKTFFILTREGQ